MQTASDPFGICPRAVAVMSVWSALSCCIRCRCTYHFPSTSPSTVLQWLVPACPQCFATVSQKSSLACKATVQVGRDVSIVYTFAYRQQALLLHDTSPDRWVLRVTVSISACQCAAGPIPGLETTRISVVPQQNKCACFGKCNIARVHKSPEDIANRALLTLNAQIAT